MNLTHTFIYFLKLISFLKNTSGQYLVIPTIAKMIIKNRNCDGTYSLRFITALSDLHPVGRDLRILPFSMLVCLRTYINNIVII